MKDDQQAGRQRGGKQRRRQSSHPPIIITDDTLDGETLAAGDKAAQAARPGDDMILRFDGRTGLPHYRDVSSTTYLSTVLRKIDSVKVTDERGRVHTCPNVTPRCTVEVFGKKNNTDEKITVTADGSKITIVFNRSPYPNETPTGSVRKKHRGPLRKIRRMVITPDVGDPHVCEAVSEAKDVRIAICDDRCVPIR